MILNNTLTNNGGGSFWLYQLGQSSNNGYQTSPSDYSGDTNYYSTLLIKSTTATMDCNFISGDNEKFIKIRHNSNVVYYTQEDGTEILATFWYQYTPIFGGYSIKPNASKINSKCHYGYLLFDKEPKDDLLTWLNNNCQLLYTNKD